MEKIKVIEDLVPGDKIPPGAVLGPFTNHDTLRVKAVFDAKNDRCAVAFNGVGTLYLHKKTQILYEVPNEFASEGETFAN